MYMSNVSVSTIGFAKIRVSQACGRGQTYPYKRMDDGWRMSSLGMP
jgi:hypothetical protein